MAWFRVRLTEEEQRVVNEERCCHPNLRIREKMLVLWLLHTGLTRQQAAKAAGVSRATVQRYVAAFRQGGLDGLRQWNLSRPVSEMAAYRELIRASFEKQPATTIAEACERIFQLTGLRRGPSQVHKFLKDLGLKFYRVRAIPVPPKKNLAEHVADQAAFLETELKPLLAAAQAGKGHVFFVDAAHFVFGTFLCYLWSFTRIFVRAASGRQRFNVLGAWNAVTRQLIAVTNTTVVNTETISELLRKIAALGLTGAITLVLDNARYQHNAAVKALASQLGITLLFLPSYSPNLNLIERLWKFTKRRALYGRYHPKFADFQAAIQEILDGIPTTYAEQLETLMTLNFQQFEDVHSWPHKVYRNGKLLIKPSKRSVKTFLAKIQETIDDSGSMTAGDMVRRLNQQIKGWTMYHRHAVSKRTFQAVDHRIFWKLMRWCRRRHRKKSWKWIKKKYFQRVGSRDWVFTGMIRDSQGKAWPIQLMHAAGVKILRWVKIRSAAGNVPPRLTHPGAI